MPHNPIRLTSAALALGIASTSLAAGGGLMHGKAPRPTDDFGHDFVKIGRPGNRDALPSERVHNVDWPDLGGVRHRYRIARTEVTATQWIEYVEAYEPYWVAAGGGRNDSRFTSVLIRASNPNPANGPPNYSIISPAATQTAVTMSWYNAARYCNWLHNGKVNEEWAFETGVYDTSTFGLVPGVGYFDQPEHSPGAKFWIPTLDEWTKAAYYDPDRYGEGEDGYWFNMAGQNEPLVSGPPGVGQTSAGSNFPPGFDPLTISVGSYLDVQSPWGLFDTSGGVSEWTGTLVNDFVLSDGTLADPSRVHRGSDFGGTYDGSADVIDLYPFQSSNPMAAPAGLRLASAIPSPGTPFVWMTMLGWALPRRTRRRW